MAYFSAPEQPLDYIKNLLDVKAGELGLNYVAYGDEDRLPKYPAAKVAAGPLDRSIHGTHQFQNAFVVDIWVYHGNLRVSHAQRSKEDLLLATSIRKLIHSDFTLGGGVVFGWISGEGPALVRRNKAPAVVCTRMVWQATALEVF